MKPLGETRQNFLCLVGHFGYVTSREISLLLYPGRGADSALVTAQTMGRKLEALGLVHTKTLPYDNLSRDYVLTPRGAAYLNDVVMETWLEHDTDTFWFADGYSLSLNQWVARRPLITVLQAAIKRTSVAVIGPAGESLRATLHPVGQRSLKRGFMGLSAYKHFDAALLDDDGKLVLGVYLAHSATTTASDYVCKLAQGSTPFIIAADTQPKLKALVRRRDRIWPEMPAKIIEIFGTVRL